MLWPRRRFLRSAPLAFAGSAFADDPKPGPAVLPHSGRIDVLDFGPSVGTGGDDTAAFHKAIEMAMAQQESRDYFGTAGPAVHVPGGLYKVSGIDVPAHISLIGDGMPSTRLVLLPHANRSLVSILPPPLSEPQPWGDFSFAQIAGLTLEGNSSAQSGTSHGLEILDAGYLMEQRYGAGVYLSDIIIINARTSGLYIGRNRNAGFVTNVFVAYSGLHGIQSYGYDWNFFGCRAGTSRHGDGMRMEAGGAATFHGTNFYTNPNGSAVGITKYVNAYVNFMGCAFDSSGVGGLTVEGGSNTIQAYISVFGGRFLDNGGGNGAHIMLRNVSAVSVTGTLFARSAGSPPPRHLVEQAGTLGKVHWTANTFEEYNPDLRPFSLTPFSHSDLRIVP